MKPRPIRVEGDIAFVPLARNGKYEAVVDVSDYYSLIALGVSPNWQMTGGNVTARIDGDLILVGRVLTGAKEGEITRYKNSNRRDLRRDNLSLTTGFSVHNHFEMLTE